jgi:small-conductance mechanosensitive channel
VSLIQGFSPPVEYSFVPFWQRLLIVAAVIVVTVILARLIDRRIARRELAPEAVTRYRVLRRSITAAVTAVGVLSALLVIPQVQAVAGGLLASSAILGLVVGFASRSTLANFVAGVLIAFTQPLRLGDRVAVGSVEGTVEEIGLTYTFIRARDNSRLVVPNEKIASDTIRNATIVSPEKLAEVTVQVPLTTDLGSVLALLERLPARGDVSEVLLSALEGNAVVTLRAWAPSEPAAERLASDLRLQAHSELRAAGVYA